MRPIACTVALLASYGAAQPQVTFGTTVVVSGGLRGVVYYVKPGSAKLPDFHALKPVGTIYTASLNVPEQSFTRGFPGITDRFEWFAIDYTGRFWIDQPGEYRFSLTSDDGAKLWIDNSLVIDNDGTHPPRQMSGSVDLAHGIHAIRVAYFQGPRFLVALVLKIKPPEQPLRVFSTDEFKPPADEWTDPRAPGDRIVIDNDFVRVIKASIDPHETTAPWEPVLNRVIVYLDAGKLDVRFEDGREQKQHFSAGDAGWSAAGGPRTIENSGHTAVREVEIELKKPGPVTPPVRPRELDPVLIDPKHNKLLFENGQVRVFRSSREPRGVEPLHEHTGAGRVAVFLTAIDATVLANGSETKLHAEAGDVTWSGPVKHATTNTGTRKFEMIVVEVK